MNPFDWAVAGVAVVGSNHRPLFTKMFLSRSEVERLPAGQIQSQLFLSEAQQLHIHFLMHASLDLMAEKVAQRATSTPAASAAGGGTTGSLMSSTSSAFTADGGNQPSSASNRTSGAGDIRFLDKLTEEGSIGIHGFQSASGIRVLLATIGEAPRDAVLPLCRSVYEAASAAMCNPFFQAMSGDLCGGSLDDSLKFRDTLERTVGPYSVTARSTRTA